jgi:hypothetical protein
MISRNVPQDMLPLGHARQILNEGWFDRLRGVRARGKKKPQPPDRSPAHSGATM